MIETVIPFTRLHCTERQNLREILPLAKPFTLLIEPSSLCNFKCTQCFQSLKSSNYFTRNRMNMPLVRFQRVIEQARQWSGPLFKVLKLSLYGEPLINSDFLEMLAIAREAGIAERIETTTNASLLTCHIAEQMVELQLDYLRVSIYATNQIAHRTTTRSTVEIGAIRDNLLQLQAIKRRRGSLRPFVSVKMMDAYDEKNERFFDMYRDVADEAFIDKPHGWIEVEGADFLGSFYGEKLSLARDDIRKYSRPRLACQMGFTTLAVRSNGSVSPCCVDFIGGTNLGNVDTMSIEELWMSTAWYEFLKMQLEGRAHEHSSCGHCDFFKSSYYMKDDIDGVPVRQLRSPGGPTDEAMT
ncbi:hypothetical protein G3480_15560 [Thiorhodococcus mannitoliphagus]|uniref:Uncharacterized protein n=1 Tax=Thiorhodococcus mannitoliphagus TaxID=329406 RepID=A0A6P1DXJ6_9GAMM|nr:radical SAM/SPASM domain-containing protein [Thiorhodococcus mannitoliphagus]NEX21711.1 hypothetical protein [Thiorhodococcus mannitoliphagus]